VRFSPAKAGHYTEMKTALAPNAVPRSEFDIRSSSFVVRH
jgi:hypothetical protein